MTEKGLIIAVTINGSNTKYYRKWKYDEKEECFELVLTNYLQKAHIFLIDQDGEYNSQHNMEEIMIYYKDMFGIYFVENNVKVEVKEITLMV